MGTVIVVTSGKGGTGKTSLTGGVASCLAALGRQVLCIDMDIGLRNLDISLGMTDRALMDFTDVLEGRCSLERAAVEHPVIRNLYLLTAPVSPPPHPLGEFHAGPAAAGRERFDYVLIDSPPAWAPAFAWPPAAQTAPWSSPPTTPPPFGTHSAPLPSWAAA